MRKGNITVLASVLAIALVAAGVGMGTMAYFSDEVTSENNVLTTGTFAMSIGSGSVSGTWTIGNFAPGQTKDATLTITNTGSLNIVWIKIRPTSIDDSDGGNPLSEMLIIDEFTVVKGIGDENEKTMPHMEGWMAGVFGDTDGELSLAEFGGSHGYWFISDDVDGPIETGQTMTVYLKFRFDEDAGNEYQGDDCTFTLTISAHQEALDYTYIGDCGYGY